MDDRLSFTLFAALLLTTCRKPHEEVSPTAVSTASVFGPRAEPPDAGQVLAPPPAASDQHPVFGLPPPPVTWGGEPGGYVRLSTYMSERLAMACGQPALLSAYRSIRNGWSVAAYQCPKPLTPTRWPLPWFSDGSFFLWAERGTVVMEVVGHVHQGPRIMQWKAYIDGAWRAQPIPEDASYVLPPDPPIPRKEAEALLAAMRGTLQDARKKACRKLNSPAPHRLWELLKMVSEEPPEVIKYAVVEVSSCGECGPSRTKLCANAEESLEDVSDWIKLSAAQ